MDAHQAPRPASSAPDDTAAASWGVFAGFVFAIGLHASGIVDDALYPAITSASMVTALIGVRRNRGPGRSWPWVLLAAVAALWTVAGVVRDSTGATGNLTSSRSLLPDLFALPGYAVFGVALFGLVRSRAAERDRGLLLDAALVAVGSMAVVFTTVIVPTMQTDGTWLPARVAVAVYPAVSIWLLVAVVQLLFIRGSRSNGFLFVVAGAASLLVGDIVYALAEVGTVTLPRNVLDVPYLLVPACLGTAALHRSVHRPLRADVLGVDQFAGLRLFAVSLALIAPVIAVAAPQSDRGRPVLVGLLAVSALLAVGRISMAARSVASARSELFKRATHDDLTGLPSRPLLVAHATSLLDNSDREPVMLMFLDLDEFKLVNDSLGHAAGDELLMKVGARLAETVRDEDVVGRIGGDEFVVVMHGLSVGGARSLADRIRREMRRPFLLAAGEVFVSTSIGITVAEHGSSADSLMQEADTAMYHSKGRGRNHVTMFDETMRKRVARRVELEQGLRRALRDDEVSVVYQPIVDSLTHRVEGFEALMRWSTTHGSFSPAEFMDVAEDSGLIVPLGSFVLNEACRQLAHWRRTIDASLTMSVNLSARQIQTSHLVDTVATALETHGVPGQSLWLEITESVMLEDSVTTAAVMNGLRQLGVRLAIDDFGTGFSSLSYLHAFPVSRVKIDRSFVNDLSTRPEATALCRAVIGIGSSMNLDVVAEGVETVDQAQRLVDLGCRRVQGYLYSPPVGAEEIPLVVNRLADHDRAVDVKHRRRTVRCRS